MNSIKNQIQELGYNLIQIRNLGRAYKLDMRKIASWERMLEFCTQDRIATMHKDSKAIQENLYNLGLAHKEMPSISTKKAA